MTQAIRITKEGKNALTSTTPDDFYLHSDYPLLKVSSAGAFSFNIALETKTITHNLGYKPFALVFSTLVDYQGGSAVFSNDYYQHDWLIAGAAEEWWGWTKIYDNKLVIGVGQTNVIVGGTVHGFYYIFEDEVT